MREHHRVGCWVAYFALLLYGCLTGASHKQMEQTASALLSERGDRPDNDTNKKAYMQWHQYE